MTLFWAVMKDSYREMLDYKVFYVCLILCAVILLALASLGFSPGSAEQGMKKFLEKELPGSTFVGFEDRGKSGFVSKFRLTFELTDPAKFLEALGELESQHYQVTAHYWGAINRKKEGEGESLKMRVRTDSPTFEVTIDQSNLDQAVQRLLRWKFERVNIAHAELSIQNLGGWKRRFVLSGETNDFTSGHSGKMSILFGASEFELGEASVAMVVWGLEVFLVDYIAGFGGALFGIIVTAFFIPHLLQKGSIELWVARPIPRWALILFKYIGGMLFVFFNVVLLIGGAFLILSWRSGYWNFGFLGSILVLMMFFAILYSVSVLFGVMTRSAVVSIVMSAVTWILGFVAFELHSVSSLWVESGRLPQWATTVSDGLYFVLPKTTELKTLNMYFLMKANGLPPQLFDRQAVSIIEQSSTALTFGSSAAFIVAMLGLACWIFSRRDN